MWAHHQRDRLKHLDDLEEPTWGRALPVGGFILGDSFDTILRNISEEYLQAAWERLAIFLKENRIVADDLSWGFMHPGETGVTGVEESPSNFIGWTSSILQDIHQHEEEHRWDEVMRYGKPSIRCASTWRSLKWRVAPNNFSLALELVEALCVDEISDWHPDIILREAADPTDLWRLAAKAIRNDDQKELDGLIEQARCEYTLIGFRILVRGYSNYINNRENTDSIKLPEWD